MRQKINLPSTPFIANQEDYVLLNVPYTQQGEHSSNCGPCSVKMLLDYYALGPQANELFKLHALNRLLQTSKLFGCDELSIERFFIERLQLTLKWPEPAEIERSLKMAKPLLCSFADELHEGHFALIIGLDFREKHFPAIIFHDPWPDFGPLFRRNLLDFLCRLDELGNWLLTFHCR